ncbi:MAG: hypothetical protein ACRET0_10125, partial [Steroidobacteraceae bacterium]
MKYKQRSRSITAGSLVAAVAALALLVPAGPAESGPVVPGDPPAAATPLPSATLTPAPNVPPVNRTKIPPGAPVPLTEAASAADWAVTLDRIASSVVAIEIDQARSFDTERN